MLTNPASDLDEVHGVAVFRALLDLRLFSGDDRPCKTKHYSHPSPYHLPHDSTYMWLTLTELHALCESCFARSCTDKGKIAVCR